MKGPAIDQLLHNTLFPQPKSSDPPNFAAFLSRNLIPEVRLETACFYGDLSTREAQYPGLNYMYGPHRARLSRFPWHRRLFRAIDSLGLTENEVLSLTRWEGTLWARRRFERENGVCVKDTTGDEVAEWVPGWTGRSVPDDESEAESEAEAEAEEQDVELQTLDARLGASVTRRRAARAPATGDAALLAMTEEWEQWLKETSENGGDISSAPEQIVRRLLALRESSGNLPEYLGFVIRGGAGTATAAQDVDVLPRREEGREAVPEGRREGSAREYARLIDRDAERRMQQVQLLQSENIARLRALRERSSEEMA